MPHAPPELILASTSPYRRQLLERLGLPFRAAAPRCDEEALKVSPACSGLGPRALAEALAVAKADSLREQAPAACIIGSDQLVACGDQVLGKPGDLDGACRQLSLLAGREHLLITALAVRAGDRLLRHTDVTRLTMRPLDADAIRRYVEADRPVDCAGAYKLEARGIALFSSIESADHAAITGLPLIALAGMLLALGYRIP